MARALKSVLVLVVLSSLSGWLASAVQNQALVERRNSQDRLRSAAAQLAAALREKLGSGRTTPTPMLVLSARNLLGDEADRLETEDSHDASLLRSYAQLAPSTILLMPVSDYMGNQGDDFGSFVGNMDLNDDDDWNDNTGTEDLGSKQQSSSESEETVYTSNNGHAVTLRTRCQDGDCVQEKVVGASPASAKKLNVRMPRASAGSVSNAISQMVDSMRAAEKAFGNDGFQNIMKDGFAFPSDADIEAQRFPGGANSTNGKPEYSTISSSVTKIDENGNVVTHSKSCKDGKCSTKVVQKKLASASGDRPLMPDAEDGADDGSSMPQANDDGDDSTEVDTPI